MPRQAPTVVLTPRQRGVLEALARSRTEEQRLVERAHIVVMCADGLSNVDQARRINVDVQRIDRWRRRWREVGAELAFAEREGIGDAELRERIVDALDDAPRSGAPPIFTAEQVSLLIALACESPADSALPINRWTPAQLAMEAVKRGIVASISPRHLDRILKRGRPAPAQEPVLDDLQGRARRP